MARCVRNKPGNQGTVLYKRHQYRDGVCKACGKVKR